MNSIKKLVGLLPESKQIIERSKIIITSVLEKPVYENGERTGKTKGYIISGTITEGVLAGTQMSIKTDESEEFHVGNIVVFKILESNIYAKTTEKSRYASVELSLIGNVSLANNSKGDN